MLMGLIPVNSTQTTNCYLVTPSISPSRNDIQNSFMVLQVSFMFSNPSLIILNEAFDCIPNGTGGKITSLLSNSILGLAATPDKVIAKQGLLLFYPSSKYIFKLLSYSPVSLGLNMTLTLKVYPPSTLPILGIISNILSLASDESSIRKLTD